MKFKLTAGGILVASLLALPYSPTTFTTQQAHAGPQSCLPGIVKKRLNQIRQRYGPVRITSSFRRNARIKGTRRPSYHATCQAVDFHPPRGTYWQVARWLQRVHNGGVGTYSCRHHHLHIDNGPRRRWHTCSH